MIIIAIMIIILIIIIIIIMIIIIFTSHMEFGVSETLFKRGCMLRFTKLLKLGASLFVKYVFH